VTIRKEVLEAMKLVGDGGATYADVHQTLGGRHTRQQIKVALYRLSHDGYLRCQPGSGTGFGNSPGRFFYLPEKVPKKKGLKQRKSRAKQPPKAVISSPWDMADGLGIQWPPKFDGGRVYCKLGPWTDD
jgi:hypothetical protein